ncbi:MAG: sulfite exporter TauE/SafE family protein [Saprospiraceae bacterium]|nr:sulfite exporter TauE/SafE family protein [Saprospiraceae bacterium]
MQLDWLQIVIAVVGGLFAGIINTLAGNGSAITLTILTEVLGLPGNMANGTNRIGILAQGLASVRFFWQHNHKAILRARWWILIIFIGAIVGVWLATRVSNEQFRTIFSYLMVAMLLVIIINPKRWLRQSDMVWQMPWYLSIPIFFSLGFYGGFIQMGMGVFFLAVMVLVARYDLIDSNAIKNVVVALYTAVVLLVFHLKGMVVWPVGLIIAVGQATGGWLAGRFATRIPGANKWAYRLLIVVVIASIFKLFGWWPF